MNSTPHLGTSQGLPFNVATRLDSLYFILQAFYPNLLFSFLSYLKKNVLNTYFVSALVPDAGESK